MEPQELVFMIEEDPEGGYLARAVGESIFTQADTIEQLRDMVRCAVSCHFNQDCSPTGIRLRFIHNDTEEVLEG